MFLTGLLFRTFLVCFLMTQIHLPRSGPGPSKNYSKDVPQICLKASLMEALSRFQFSSQVIWVFVKLIKANQNRKFIVLSSLRMVSVSQPRPAPGFYGEKKKGSIFIECEGRAWLPEQNVRHTATPAQLYLTSCLQRGCKEFLSLVRQVLILTYSSLSQPGRKTKQDSPPRTTCFVIYINLSFLRGT